MPTLKHFLGLFVLLASGVAAGEPLDIQPYRQAHARFLELLGAAEASSGRDLRTPEFASLTSILSDQKRFLAARPFTPADMPNVMDLCDMANRNDVSLMLFDLKAQLNPQMSPAEQASKMMSLMMANTIRFQPELTRLAPFHIHCLGLTVPLIAEFVRELPAEQMNPVRREGLAKVRSGYTEMLAGLMQIINDTRCGLDFRGAIAKAMAETAPALVSLLTLPQRAQLLLMMGHDPAGAKLPVALAANLAHIKAALADETCSGLCLL